MIFRTEVHIPNSEKKISVEDKIFSIGSCFAKEMTDILQKGQLQTLNNPFGTIFNPFSICHAIQKLHDFQKYTEEDLITYQGQYLSLDHHSSFNTPYAHKTLEKINQQIEIGNHFLQETNWIIITYGSAFIYEFLPQHKLVANCHKIPQKYFQKRMLSTTEIKNSIQQSIDLLKDICPENLQIIFTISPVRHTRDGIIENQYSKARLINALHEALEGQEHCHYLPIYEIMMDDLRDYRFYKEDMVHPTPQTVQYIFEKFSKAYFQQETLQFISENFKILQGLEHRPSDENSPKHKEFLSKIYDRIKAQQEKVRHRIFV